MSHQISFFFVNISQGNYPSFAFFSLFIPLIYLEKQGRGGYTGGVPLEIFWSAKGMRKSLKGGVELTAAVLSSVLEN